MLTYTVPVLCCGFDVLVEVEKIRWVVLILQGYQALECLSIVSRSNSFLPLVTQEVDVNPARREGLHRGPEVARPSFVPVGFSWVCPHRFDVQKRWRSAMGIGCFIVVDPADGSLQVGNEDLREGRRFPISIGGNHINGLIA